MKLQRAVAWLALPLAIASCQGQVPAGAEGYDDDGKADGFGEASGETGGFCPRGRDAVEEVLLFNGEASPEDQQDKFCKMAESPFVFFRGTNHLFWLDLGRDARLDRFGVRQGEWSTRIWLQGDLHAANFGSFDDDEGTVVYDLNDFDEAIVGDFQLDLWRMATSLVLIAHENGRFDTSDVEDVLDAFTDGYLDAMAGYRGGDQELRRTFTEDSTRGLLDDFLDEVEDEESRESMLDRWTVLSDGRRRFDLENDDLEPAPPEVTREILGAMSAYQQTLAGGLDPDREYFAVLDVARRLDAGTGSLGTPRFYVLIEGESDDPGDDRVLDVKRQGPPTPQLYLGPAPELAGVVSNDADRTVTAQRAMGADADDHLGWLALSDGDYSVRERSPWKETFPVEDIDSASDFVAMAEQWGEILATAHARADRDFDEGIIGYSIDRNVDEATDGRRGELRDLVREVALEYALQVRYDHQAFVDDLALDETCP